MKTVEDYRKDILDTLKAEQAAVPGRAGETPVSNMAHDFSKLESQESANAVAALENLVVNPQDTAAKIPAQDYWRTLNFLLHYINHQDSKKILQPVFHQKLFDDSFRQQQLNVYFLHGLIASGGKLRANELEDDILWEIRDYAPLAWVGAAVMSDHLELARQNAVMLLKRGSIDIPRLLASLPHWQKVWGGIIGEEAFTSVVKEFIDAIPSDEGKEKIRRWLQRRQLL